MRALAPALALALAAIGARAHAQAPGPAAGADLFEDRCAMCHLERGAGQGPSLAGVVGRKAGSSPGFAYTPALKGSGLTWTPAALDRFLANPGAAVPGTAMLVRITDPKQRADLIRYLAGRS